MIKIIRDTIYLLYRHYNGGGTKSIAYESALITASFFFIIHVMQIKVLFWGGGLTFGNTKAERLFSAAIIIVPVYVVLYLGFKKRDVLEKSSSINLRKGYFYLLLYIFLTFTLLVLLILNNKNII